MNKVTGAALLVRTLVQAGVRRLFTLCGNQALPVYDVCIDAGVALIDVRHEAAAVHMADAYARLTGEPSVCLVSGGAGQTNALTGLAVAQAAESPVVVLAGCPDTRQFGKGAFQETDQVSLSAPVAKLSRRPTTAAEVPAEILAALATARSGRPGPVHVSLPSDVLAAETDDTAPAPSTNHHVEPAAIDPTATNQVAEALAAAQRPVVLAGPAAARGRCRDALQAFLGASGVPGFVIESPRGLNDSSLLGAGALVRRADLVILVGKRQDFTIGFAQPPAIAEDATLVQIDSDATVLNKNRRASVAVHADVERSLRQLMAALVPHSAAHDAWAQEFRATAEAYTRGWSSLGGRGNGPPHPIDVCRALAEVIAPDDFITSDGGEFCQWPQAFFRDRRPVVPGPLGAIGGGVPFALGARLARSAGRVFAFAGDGAFGFHAMEFDTAVRHRLPVVVIVGNDAAWTTERYKQVFRYGAARVTATELARSRYDQLAIALGAVGETVERTSDLVPALRRCVAANRPACLNVHIETALGPSTKPSGPGH